MDKLPRLLTAGEVAEMLGVDKPTVISWTRSKGDFPQGLRITPRLVLFEENAVREFIQRLHSGHIHL